MTTTTTPISSPATTVPLKSLRDCVCATGDESLRVFETPSAQRAHVLRPTRAQNHSRAGTNALYGAPRSFAGFRRSRLASNERRARWRWISPNARQPPGIAMGARDALELPVCGSNGAGIVRRVRVSIWKDACMSTAHRMARASHTPGSTSRLYALCASDARYVQGPGFGDTGVSAVRMRRKKNICWRAHAPDVDATIDTAIHDSAPAPAIKNMQFHEAARFFADTPHATVPVTTWQTLNRPRGMHTVALGVEYIFVDATSPTVRARIEEAGCVIIEPRANSAPSTPTGSKPT